MKISEIKELTESIKNTGTIIICIILGVILYLKIDWKSLKIESFEIGGMKLVNASNDVNTRARTETKQSSDIKVDLASVPVTKYLDFALHKNGTYYWVYIGQYKPNGDKKTWLTKNFSFLNSSPIKQLTALNDVYKRDALPFQIGKSDDWKLGTIIGLVNKGTTLTVVRDTTIEDQNIWALIQE